MAGIDALIAQGTSTGPGGFDPLEVARLSQQIQAARQNQAIQAQQQQQVAMQQQAAMERQQQLQGLAGQGGTPQEMAGRFRQAGFLPESMELEKHAGAQETERLNQQGKIGGIIKNASAQLLANPTEATGLALATQLQGITGQNMDDFKSQIIEARGNPELIKRIAAGYALEADKLLPKADTLTTGPTIQDRTIDPLTGRATVVGETPVQLTPYQQEQIKLEQSQQGLTRRGQDLADARSRDANQLKAAEAVGGPKLTEIQAKAQLFGNRAQEANRIISGLEGKYSPLAVNAKLSAEGTPGIGGILGTAGNKLLGENEQLAEQAQRDFINAVLRQESGAVISPEEFKNAQKQYFPQPGDTKNTLKQKQNNRERAIKGFDVMSGPAGGFAKPATKQDFNLTSMPDPARLSGKLIESDDGVKYRSNGTSWVKVK